MYVFIYDVYTVFLLSYLIGKDFWSCFGPWLLCHLGIRTVLSVGIDGAEIWRGRKGRDNAGGFMTEFTTLNPTLSACPGECTRFSNAKKPIQESWGCSRVQGSATRTHLQYVCLRTHRSEWTSLSSTDSTNIFLFCIQPCWMLKYFI